MRPSTAVCLVAALLALAGCGSSSRVAAPPPPKLPRTIATELADRSDALAVALTRNDGCAARVQIHALESQTRAAFAAGRVPSVFHARLLAAIQSLAARLPGCSPPPPPPVRPPAKPKPPKKGHGDHGNHGHGKGDQGDQG